MSKKNKTKIKFPTSEHSKFSKNNKEKEEYNEFIIYRKKSRKFSKDEIKIKPYLKQTWNNPYPIIEPSRP